MPEVLSVFGIKRYQVTIVIAHKHHAARGGHCSRPHSPTSRHGVLPGALRSFRVNGAEDDLSSFFSRPSSGKVLHRLRLLRGAAKHAALLERNHVKKASARMITLAHPVRGAFHAR